MDQDQRKVGNLLSHPMDRQASRDSGIAEALGDCGKWVSFTQPPVGDVDEVGGCPETAKARLGCCFRPFIASIKALQRLSRMPRTTTSKCDLSQEASCLNEFSRLRRACDSQALSSAPASSGWLCKLGLAKASRSTIISCQAPALLRFGSCSQCMTLVCRTLKLVGCASHRVQGRAAR